MQTTTNQTIDALLREAHEHAKAQFWATHATLAGEYKNSLTQLEDIKELARLGNLIAKIVEARNHTF
tara:strand:- start:55 stop:255 length:201 start_codon:yes stop_codon:yes gene_type:complete